LTTKEYFKRWKTYLNNPVSRVEFTVTILLLVITVFSFSRYLLFNEARHGAVLDDPLLKHFNAIDLNPVLFFAIYSSLIIGLVSFSFTPNRLLLAFQTYTLMVLFRMTAMYLVPLDPPPGCIDLDDPVVFILGTGQKIIKDLFFSGHTSTAFMLFQIARNKFLKGYFLIATITVGSCVILQKAHYTIDVFAGLVFSYTSYQLVKSFHRKFKSDLKHL
jgi:membrane-associated phospholipid phosphatase